MEEVLRLAGAAEARSGQPLAEAVVDELERRGMANDLPIEKFENIAGHRVRAIVNGHAVLVGAPRLLGDSGSRRARPPVPWRRLCGDN